MGYRNRSKGTRSSFLDNDEQRHILAKLNAEAPGEVPRHQVPRQKRFGLEGLSRSSPLGRGVGASGLRVVSTARSWACPTVGASSTCW